MEEGIVLESVWVAIGFIVFLIMVWRKARTALFDLLDDRSAKIREDLKVAQDLREEALAELENYKKLQHEAVNEAKAIVKAAEAAAERISAAAEEKSLMAIKRREQQAESKIKAAEANLIAELRERAASLAVATATEIITSNLDEKHSLAIVDESTSEIEKLN